MTGDERDDDEDDEDDEDDDDGGDDEARALELVAAPTVTEAELCELAAHPSSEVRLLVAQHARVTAPALAKLAEADDARILELVARNPRTPSAILDELADDNFWVASNPAAPPATIERMARGDHSARWFVAMYTGRGELLTALAADPDAKVRAAVAGNVATPVAALERLASEDVEEIRAGVAANQSATAAALARVAAKPNGGVTTILRQAMGLDSRGSIHELVAMHAAVTGATLAMLVGSSFLVRERVARHVLTPRAALKQLARDSHPTVKAAARANPGCPWWIF